MAGISKAEREALAQVKNKFDAVELTDEQSAAVEALRKGFSKLAVEVHRSVPEGRNKSLAFTALEDACMRAIRGISHDVAPEPTEEPAAAVDPVEEVVAATEGATEVPQKKVTRKPRKRTAPAVEASAA